MRHLPIRLYPHVQLQPQSKKNNKYDFTNETPPEGANVVLITGKQRERACPSGQKRERERERERERDTERDRDRDRERDRDTERGREREGEGEI